MLSIAWASRPPSHPPPGQTRFGTAPVVPCRGHGASCVSHPSPPVVPWPHLVSLLQWSSPSSAATMVDLIYWKDVKKTGVVFGGFLALFISLAYVSFISVLSYTSLTVLSVTIIYRVYKNIMQAIQKSQDGHPFKNLLELDTDLPLEKVHDASDAFVNWWNPKFTEVKRLFLVEDLVDSVKFGCLLWCLTYVGSWFNGLTLVTLATVALFTLPKVYEQNKTQVDQYMGLVKNQVNDVMSKVKAALPIGNKEKTQ
ncbi:reticulon-1-A-like isoform X2 [Homarus americanus]|uniref:reticulon-1-A-like isoform X2 n=1 Tax=Homarus americanus TaxID=6706 RepID=UPI001C46C5DE|nr:reticulon-1-A-like isoform X2 [Homarus americanus]